MENTELLPLGTEQGREETEYSSFDLCLGESFVSPLVEQHRQWLKSIRHETPSPKIPFKVAVYIRFLIRRNMGTRNISSVTKRFFVLRWRSTLYGSLWASILTMGRPHLIWRNHRHGLSFCLTVMRKSQSHNHTKGQQCIQRCPGSNDLRKNARCSKASRWHLLHIRRSIHFGIVLSRRSSRALFSPSSRLEDPA